MLERRKRYGAFVDCYRKKWSIIGGITNKEKLVGIFALSATNEGVN